MTGIKALWALILAHPVAAVVVAIVASIVILWNKCEAFREFWIGAWEKCKESFSKFADWCGESIENLKEGFAEWRDKINEKFSDIGNWFKERFADIKKAQLTRLTVQKRNLMNFGKRLTKNLEKSGIGSEKNLRPPVKM